MTEGPPEGFHGQEKIPGYNVDALDIAAGLEELKACGYTDSPETTMVIQYALQRHARGEEEAAKRGAIDKSFHGISFTCWLRVLAAAMAGAQQSTSTPPLEGTPHNKDE